MPAIEAYAHVDRWEDARDLTLASFSEDPNYGRSLCRLWDRIGKATPPGAAQGIRRRPPFGPNWPRALKRTRTIHEFHEFPEEL